MKTSFSQYVMMVDFMETNGDLSKPSGGPRDRNFIQMKWKELANQLNSDGAGDPRSEEKWRKVWSDYKNNTKKKCAKIIKAAGGTGGGPALQLYLTELENRVMQIVGVQAAAGMEIQEAAFQHSEDVYNDGQNPVEVMVEESPQVAEIEWNIPGTSSQPTVAPPPSQPEDHHLHSPPASPAAEWQAPPQKRRKTTVAQMFIESDRNAREYARERDRAYEDLERERLRTKNEELRVRELEIQERVRQRDVELRLQAEWLELMKEALKVFVRYTERKS